AIIWGDGQSTSLTLNPGTLTFATSHQYADNPSGQPAGSYLIVASVTDQGGAQARAATLVQVNNVAPVASVGGPYSGWAGLPIAFAATATDPSPTDSAAGLTYSWDFGDGTTSNLPTPSNTYATAGDYTVAVTVRDKDGGASTVTTSATVNP